MSSGSGSSGGGSGGIIMKTAAPGATAGRVPRVWVVEADSESDADPEEGTADLTPRETGALKYAMTMCMPYLRWWDLRLRHALDDDDPDVQRDGLRSVMSGTFVGATSRAAARSVASARCYVIAFHNVEELMSLLPQLGRPEDVTPEFWAAHAFAVDAQLMHGSRGALPHSVTIVAGFFRHPRSFSYVHDIIGAEAWVQGCRVLRGIVRMGPVDVDRMRAVEALRILVGNVSPVHERAARQASTSSADPTVLGARFVDGLRAACFTCGVELGAPPSPVILRLRDAGDAEASAGGTTCEGCGVVRFCSADCRRAAASADRRGPSHDRDLCMHAWMLGAVVRPAGTSGAMAAIKEWDSAPGVPLVMTHDGVFNDAAYSTLLWDVSADPLTSARLAPGFVKPTPMWEARDANAGVPIGAPLTEAHWRARTAVRAGDRISVPAFCAVVRVVGDEADEADVAGADSSGTPHVGGGVTTRQLLCAIHAALNAPCTAAHVRAIPGGARSATAIAAAPVPGRTRVVQLNPWARRFSCLKERDVISAHDYDAGESSRVRESAVLDGTWEVMRMMRGARPSTWRLDVTS